jgi:bifunctional non-homologous end joining protein LigD
MQRNKKKLDSLPRREAGFIEPMECLAVTTLPDGQEWVYKIKLDGYRAVAINSQGKLILFSRRRKPFNAQYPYIMEALCDLPENTVVDGEVAALNDAGRPDFNLLQHSRSQASRICYFVFDLLIYENRDLTRLPFIERGQIMSSMLKFRSSRIRVAQHFETSAEEMVRAVRQQGLEGVIAKRKDSPYEAGKRSGSWTKYRVNRGQELVNGRIRARSARFRFNRRRLLQGQGSGLHRQSQERICTCHTTTSFREVTAFGGGILSIHESA